MVSSLRHVVQSMYKNIDYKYYYDKMLRDYKRGSWDFDISTVVKLDKMPLPCPKNMSSNGTINRTCLIVINEETFRVEFARYMDNYAIPMSEIWKNKILARKIWLKKNGFISRQQKECRKANYNCSHCINRLACQIAGQYSKDDKRIIKMTKMLEVLYGNILCGYWANLADRTDNGDEKLD